MHRSTVAVCLGVLLVIAPIVGCADGADEAGEASQVAPAEVETTAATDTTSAPADPVEETAAGTTAGTTGGSSAVTPVGTASETVPTGPSVAGDRPIVTFAEPASVSEWSNVDDTVMGGVSASTTSWEAGRMVFSGELSLDNNGGFTSVRGPIDPSLGALVDGATALVVDAEGDGRTYVLQLRTADESLYTASLGTVDGVEQRVVLPLADFAPVTRFLEPSPGSPPLDASALVQFAIYLLDGQEGGFRLAVAGIDIR